MCTHILLIYLMVKPLFLKLLGS